MSADFNAVWCRVTGTGTTDNEALLLRRWMENEAASARLFSSLARQSRDSGTREVLFGISRREQRHWRALRTFHYLRSGKKEHAEKEKPVECRPLLQTLRQQYEAITEQAEGYDKAANQARPDLRELLGALHDEELRTAEELRALVGRLL